MPRELAQVIVKHNNRRVVVDTEVIVEVKVLLIFFTHIFVHAVDFVRKAPKR